MLVVGLTGGIATGKSTVAILFTKLGVPVIDADAIARDLTKPNSPAFDAIVNHFKPSLLQPDGTLNRSKLRDIVFSNEKDRRWLEALLHPLIEEEIKKQLQPLKAPYCIVVIPLLVEVEPYSFIDRILVIDTPEALQIERAMQRDRAPISQIKAIMKTQAKRHHRLAKAQDIILNTSSLTALETQVKKLHDKYTKI